MTSASTFHSTPTTRLASSCGAESASTQQAGADPLVQVGIEAILAWLRSMPPPQRPAQLYGLPHARSAFNSLIACWTRNVANRPSPIALVLVGREDGLLPPLAGATRRETARQQHEAVRSPSTPPSTTRSPTPRLRRDAGSLAPYRDTRLVDANRSTHPPR
jgi:hypothetical protein